MNREDWLNQIAAKMAPRFEELGHPLPKFRVTFGFNSCGMRGRANGECWAKTASKDDTFEIIISIGEDDVYLVAAILAHELAHCAVGFSHGHGGRFSQVLAAIGLKRPWTSSVPTPAFNDWVQTFIDEIGTLPHAALQFRPGRPRFLGVDGLVGDGDDGQLEPDCEEPTRGGVSTRKPKQGTRLIKAVCDDCGYTVRVTQKWLDVGPPHCPEHGAMKLITPD